MWFAHKKYKNQRKKWHLKRLLKNFPGGPVVKKLCFRCRGQLLYNTGFISAIHQRESATGIHMSPLSSASLPPFTPSHPSRLSQSTGFELPASCSKFPQAHSMKHQVALKRGWCLVFHFVPKEVWTKHKADTEQTFSKCLMSKHRNQGAALQLTYWLVCSSSLPQPGQLVPEQGKFENSTLALTLGWSGGDRAEKQWTVAEEQKKNFFLMTMPKNFCPKGKRIEKDQLSFQNKQIWI